MSIMYFLPNYLIGGFFTPKTKDSILVSILTSPPYDENKDTVTLYVGKNLYYTNLLSRNIYGVFAGEVTLKEYPLTEDVMCGGGEQ